MFLGFGLDAWITIVTVLGMFTTLLTTVKRLCDGFSTRWRQQ